jgi:hypothetical protein
MNQKERTAQFKTEFSELIERAMREGASLAQMAHSLSEAEFELRLTSLQMRREQAAADLATKILPLGKIVLPPTAGN